MPPIHPMTPANAESWIGTAFVLVQQQFNRSPTKDELVQLANASAAGADQDGLRAIMATWPPTELDMPPTPVHKGESGFLHTDGIRFMTDQNQEWLFAGYTMHTIMVNLKNDQDINPLLDEAISYGANTIVSIGTHLSQWKRDNGFFLNPSDPGYRDLLSQYFDTLATKQLRVAHAVLADVQGLSQGQQQDIWGLSCDVAKGRWNVLLRLGNESNVNNWDRTRFSKPDLAGVLASTGSYGGNNPCIPPHWDFAEWEGRRDPVYKALDDAGAGVLELQHGYGNVPAVPCPLVGIEHAFFHDVSPDMYGDTRWTSVPLAVQLGVEISSNCAGGAFGASDALVGRPLQPHAADMARGFFRGLWAGFVR